MGNYSEKFAESEIKEELSKLLHTLLNEGEMVIKWERKIQNKGNAILSGLAA